ncbi:MAG: hypothetical protein K2Y22_03015 [Candidatus Obscuribacterales bacterium]|nr:hypothetical protein [Candidatus Obscuribacterales bacterium]
MLTLSVTIFYWLLQMVIYYCHGKSLSGTIFDIGFGFGPVATHLAESGSFKIAFDPWTDYLHASASRMPLIPIFLAIIYRLSDSLALAMCIKNIVLNAILFSTITMFVKRHQIGKLGLLIIAIALLTPQTVFHSGSVDYEEGYLIQLIAVTTALLLVETKANDKHPYLLSVLAAVEYLIKSSMVFVAVWIAIARGISEKSLKVALVTAVPTMLSVLCWGITNSLGHLISELP